MYVLLQLHEYRLISEKELREDNEQTLIIEQCFSYVACKEENFMCRKTMIYNKSFCSEKYFTSNFFFFFNKRMDEYLYWEN